MFCSETSCLTQLLKSTPCLSRSFSVSGFKLKSLVLSELIFCAWWNIWILFSYLQLDKNHFLNKISFFQCMFCLLCHYIQLYTYWWPHWAPMDSSKSELIQMALIKQKRSSNQTKSHENLGNGPVRMGDCWDWGETKEVLERKSSQNNMCIYEIVKEQN